MSTRATIIVKERNTKAWMYHHSDGYPMGVGRNLKNFLKERRWWYLSDIVTDLIKHGTTQPDGWKDDGYEFTTCQHGDVEYTYEIDCDKKTLRCFALGENKMNFTHEVEIPD
jgi:hypothetical protein